MGAYVTRSGLQVATALAEFIEAQALPESGVAAQQFWDGLADVMGRFAPENAALLAKREALQAQIDAWHIARRGQPHDAAAYQAFLAEIGYLVPEGPDFTIETTNIDPEIASTPGPQLVVPVTNARFALNAVNARWGSLYDALYGTDALGSLPAGGGYDAARGGQVIAWVRGHLDQVAPLAGGSWAEITGLAVKDGALILSQPQGETGLRDPSQFAGWRAEGGADLQILLQVNGLHIEIVVDPRQTIGATDAAGISDVRVEAAVSTIMDCEDSVACVDGPDKAQAYGNWLGLMRGDLVESFEKGGKTVTRKMAPAQIAYHAPAGGEVTVKGRSLLWVRNVGHLMTTPAVLDAAGAELPEGLLDAMVTVLCACHDLRGAQGNSARGSVYVVKPKMHGPEEVAFAVRVFDAVEDGLGLPRNTVKLGIMDEERRTSANLRECIRAAKERVAFINTGFLDRTGDEIHTSMEAGPVLPKGEMKTQPWITSYEMRNVDIGLACGLQGKAQIGKGMWAIPDQMAEMLRQKIAHPQAGATCAWVPSPTAAILHATHYHLVNVMAVQRDIAAKGARGTLDDLLTLPLATGRNFSEAEITRELENNAQGILGYVVRWVDQGIGCSKVPDINDVGLMEDRATCRISAQALANWLHHGVVGEDQVLAVMRKMAVIVDRQNAGDPLYESMAPAFDSPAFRAACDLVLQGRVQPSGYTEPVLHRERQIKKSAA